MFTEATYLGTSLDNPIKIVQGRVNIVSGLDSVELSIVDILQTPRGTRYFLPEYGSRVHELLFEPNDEILERTLRFYVLEALQWEKRVNFTEVEIELTEDLAVCRIFYKKLKSNEIKSFIYPFYRELIT